MGSGKPRIWILLVLLAGWLGLAAAAPAQTAMPPKDPDFEIQHFDVQAEIRTHVGDLLPASWWASEPQRYLEGFQVYVHIADEWRGNPTAAMMTLCPDWRSPIWQATQSIRLQPVYRHLPWAEYQCLP